MLCDGETKLMYFFMVEDGELLKIYNELDYKSIYDKSF